MLVRVLQIGIGIFWLATMGYLVRDIYFEQGNRLTEANVDYVLDTLYNWNNAADLTLMENGRNIGRLNVAAAKDLADPENGPRRLSMSAVIEGRARTETTGSIRLKGTATLSAERDLLAATVDFNQGRHTAMSIRMQGVPVELEAKIVAGGKTLLDYTGDPASFSSGMPALPLGMPLPILGENLDQTSNFFDGLTAWQGTSDFDGRSIPILMLKKTISEEQEIRIYITEAGEPLKVETDIGIEAISNILMAQDLPMGSF